MYSCFVRLLVVYSCLRQTSINQTVNSSKHLFLNSQKPVFPDFQTSAQLTEKLSDAYLFAQDDVDLETGLDAKLFVTAVHITHTCQISPRVGRVDV